MTKNKNTIVEKFENYIYVDGGEKSLIDFIDSQISNPNNLIDGPYSPTIEFDGIERNTTFYFGDKLVELGEYDIEFERFCLKMDVKQNTKYKNIFNRYWWILFYWLSGNYANNKQHLLNKKNLTKILDYYHEQI